MRAAQEEEETPWRRMILKYLMKQASIGSHKKIFHRLNPGLFLNDLFLNRYAILFNQWEAGKVSSDPEYKPAIVVSSYLISELSGHKLGDPTIAYKKFRRFGLSGSAYALKKEENETADTFTICLNIFSSGPSLFCAW